jgi:predicted regulator of Ras-like GTPase activity (Roadblock/LC7/MglB family)
MMSKPSSNQFLLQEILDDLTTQNPEILCSLVVSDDGLNVASGLPHEEDDSIALITSDLMDMGKNFSNRLRQGRLNQILLEGEQRTTVVVEAGTHTVLAVSMPAGAKLGLVMRSVRQAATQIAAIFG